MIQQNEQKIISFLPEIQLTVSELRALRFHTAHVYVVKVVMLAASPYADLDQQHYTESLWE